MWLTPRLGTIGTLLLTNTPSRRWLNRTYERLGSRSASVFNLLFDGVKPPVDFVWECEVGGRRFSMPVHRAMPRTWNAARVWRWSGNRYFRRFYELLLKARQPGVLWDVGANDGTHTYPFAAHGFECLCFEPQPTCAEYILEVAKLNGFEHIAVIPCAVTERDDVEYQFYVSESTWYSSLSKRNVERFEPAHETVVKSVTLDSVAQKRGLRPTMIKIDVEGAEWSVIQGARTVIGEARPEIILEIYRSAPERPAVWELLRTLDYDFVTIGIDEKCPFQRLLTLDDFVQFPSSDVALLPRSSFSTRFPPYRA